MLNKNDVEQIVELISQKMLSDLLVSVKTTIVEDFDGEEVIHIAAELTRQLDFDRRSDFIDAIRVKLLSQDDRRFVFLDQFYPEMTKLGVLEKDGKA